ncbi:C40 family peptidase [Paenibacillus sp. J2TS4]|uniref:C40 family peptidase n=1 Tax=Paenibacillus sp. J2TS4 TaxID=2807194 RepID=UPI001B00E062|nr:C40 family peptidase [Paenibacillus sp. J2TS4]GIP36546.1 hypothetical protein J2TS4_57560 [Paenibacillus sp. J2TS4]
MRKAVVGLFSFVLLFSFMLGSASAETPLSAEVDALVGTPYLWAGTTEAGFDCSGFTKYLFAKFDIELSRSSKTQAKEGTEVDKADLRVGDLVFFNTDGNGISHVGVYMGDGEFAHSATDEGVTISRMDEKYYAKRYVTSRRILGDDTYKQLTAEQ